LQMIYSVKYQNTIVGQAELIKQGMYYRISCQCRLPKDGWYRLYLDNGVRDYDIGLFVPAAGEYRLVSSVPMRRFCGTDFQFTVKSMQPEEIGRFFSVEVHEPFAELMRLEHACYKMKNGQVGIWISELYSNDSSKPTGQ